MSVVFAAATTALVRTAQVYQTATLCSMSAAFVVVTGLHVQIHVRLPTNLPLTR